MPTESGPQAYGEQVYDAPPWDIYTRPDQTTYVMSVAGEPPILVAAFTPDHSRGVIHHRTADHFLNGNCESLTLFPTDQILFSRVLAERQGCIIHSAGMILNGQGLLFAGHSRAGKSTITTLLKTAGQILCDDRNIVRRHPDGWRLYGTWSHGDIPDVSPASAPLRAILLLEQAPETAWSRSKTAARSSAGCRSSL